MTSDELEKEYWDEWDRTHADPTHAVIDDILKKYYLLPIQKYFNNNNLLFSLLKRDATVCVKVSTHEDRLRVPLRINGQDGAPAHTPRSSYFTRSPHSLTRSG